MKEANDSQMIPSMPSSKGLSPLIQNLRVSNWEDYPPEIQAEILAMVEEAEEIDKELNYRSGKDPLAFTALNPAQRRALNGFIEAPKILIIPMGNGTGKTFLVITLVSAVIWPTENPRFDHPIFKKWPYRKRIRIISTTKNLEDGGSIQEAIKATFPKGRYHMTRGAGKGYYSSIYTDTGFFIDLMTYNQDDQEFAGPTIGMNVFIEPPPRDIMNESISRTRAGGINVIDMTPLDQAPYIKYEYIDAGALKDENGNVVGKITTVPGEIHENCKDCFEGGQLPHNEIMATIASWPVEEREARKKGLFMQMAGLIYHCYGDNNEWDELPEYHQECYDKGLFTLYHVVDPHDSKPFAMGWFLVFPNGDKVGVAEYPVEPFEGMIRAKVDMDDYRHYIIETEKAFGRPADVRLMDPNFGNSPKLNGQTVQQIFMGACEACKKANRAGQCEHRLYFKFPPDDISTGHLLMRKSIGNIAEKAQPKYFNLKRCRNLCIYHRRYGYKIDTKTKRIVYGDKVELEFKDFCDLPRYAHLYNGMIYLGNQERYELPAPSVKLHRPA